LFLEIRGENEQKTATTEKQDTTEKPGNSTKLGSYAFFAARFVLSMSVILCLLPTDIFVYYLLAADSGE